MNSLRRISVYLMLISGISPLHILSSSFEHFPWGLVCLLLFGRANIAALMLVAAATAYLAVGALVYEVQGVPPVLTIIPMIINILSPLFFFRGNEELLGDIAHKVFWTYVAVGCLQYFSLLTPFENIIELLISRFSGSPVGIGYRGVQMLETEPARASYQLMALFLITTSLSQVKKYRLLIALLFSQLVLITSTTGILLSVLYLSIITVMASLTRPSMAIMGLIFLAAVSPSMQENPKSKLLIEMYRADGWEGAQTALAAVSGGRFLALSSAIISVAEFPLGRGPDPEFFDGEKLEVNEYQVEGYATRVSARPTSAALTFTVALGLPVLIATYFAMASIAGHARMAPNVIFAIVMSIVYSPPFGEATLLVLMSTIYAANREFGRSQKFEAKLAKSPPFYGQT